MDILGHGYFDDWTHPLTQDFEHHDWNAFTQNLTNACNSVFPRTATRYTNVHVLLMNWVDDDLQTDSELNDLESQWKSQFNFTTEIWRIPSLDAENKLEQKLSWVKADHGESGKLLIVYYGGHGSWDPNNRSIWAANCNSDSPTLVWSDMQSMLKRASCDVLIILDCCYAGSAGRDRVSGTKELLAACGMEVEAEGVTHRSFTRNLIHKLRSFRSQAFTVSQLYERLLKSKKRLQNTPQYIPLSGRGRPSIIIAPVESSTSATSLVSPSSSSQDLSTSSIFKSSSSTSTLFSSDSCRVLLAISLIDESTIPNLESWIKWLVSEAPEDILRIKVNIEEAYPGKSTLLLVSIPVSIWNCLPDTSAYRFIDLITGDSLLKRALSSTATFVKEIKEKSMSQEEQMRVEQHNTMKLIDKLAIFKQSGGLHRLQTHRKHDRLHELASDGHEAAVRLLLDLEADFYAQSGHHGSKSYESSIQGHETTVRLLLILNAIVSDSKYVHGQTPLSIVAELGQELAMQLLLDAGIDVNVRNESNRTALHAASEKGQATMVRLLLDAGANVNLYDILHETPLQAASNEGHIAVVRLLLNAGADINAPTVRLRTALHLASKKGHIEIIKLLLSKGALVDARDKYGITALQAAAREGHATAVLWLLHAGTDVDACGGFYGTALQAASKTGHIEVVRLLLNAGAKVDVRDMYDNTALQAAARGGHTSVVQLLLNAGVDVNAGDGTFGTALHAASRKGHVAIMELLLNAEANVNALDKFDNTALEAAATEGHITGVQLLIIAGADVESFDAGMYAASKKKHKSSQLC